METGQTLRAPSANSTSVAPTYRGWSIFNIICCCWPLGACALYYSGKVKTANEAGDTVAAQDASKTAMTLNIIALICGLILIPIVLYYQFQNLKHH
uniref:Uncharacterized protein n=1 Tax=Xiphophorus maculatus TaxID=8083 RepID=M4A3D8_XIPMA